VIAEFGIAFAYEISVVVHKLAVFCYVSLR